MLYSPNLISAGKTRPQRRPSRQRRVVLRNLCTNLNAIAHTVTCEHTENLTLTQNSSGRQVSIAGSCLRPSSPCRNSQANLGTELGTKTLTKRERESRRRRARASNARAAGLSNRLSSLSSSSIPFLQFVIALEQRTMSASLSASSSSTQPEPQPPTQDTPAFRYFRPPSAHQPRSMSACRESILMLNGRCLL